MNEALKEYLKGVKSEADAYLNAKIVLKEYLEVRDDVKKWLKERCNENSGNR